MKLYAVREKETGKLVIEDPKREDVPVVEEGKPAKICPWCGRSLT